MSQNNAFDYDLFVIGAGSGGVRAARMSSQYGAKVVVAEESYLGGTCVNVGCVPKKLFVYASEFKHHFSDSAGFGWSIPEPPTFNWEVLRDNKTAEIERLNGIYQNLLQNAGVEVIDGRAVITGPNEVEVNGQRYSADKILVATGGWPFVPGFPGNEHAITSNEAFYLDKLPKDIMIVGGGYIAVEFACIFNGLGVNVDQLYRGPLFMRGFDQEIREHLSHEMAQAGVNLHFNTDIQAIEKQHDGQYLVTLSSGDQKVTGLVMYATGRNPKTDGLGLENTAIELSDNGAIKVNDQFQTAESSIYAIGDVIDRVALTPVAIGEAMCLSNNLFATGSAIQTMNYANIPTAVFSQPTIGTVGLTEEQAKASFNNVQVYKSHFRALKNTLSNAPDKTFMKLIVDGDSDKVVGCHMLGEYAGEILQGIGIAIKAGATKADFDATVGIHPSAAEEFVTMRTAS